MTKGSKGRQQRAEAAKLIESAARAFKDRRNGDAFTALSRASQLMPDDAEVLSQLGRACVLTGRHRQAVDVLNRSLALRPVSGETRHRMGLALRALGSDPTAIAAFQDAVQQSPELFEAHRDLGDILMVRGRREEAAAAYERAAGLQPETTAGRLQKVAAAMALDRLGDAEQALRLIVEKEPKHGRALQLLGLVLQLTGKLDEAEPFFARAIEADPTNAAAYHGLAECGRRSEADRPWLDRISAQLASSDYDRRFGAEEANRRRMTLHFSAGKILDDVGDYAAAMKHFESANAIRKRFSPFQREQTERRADALVTRYTAEFIASCRSIGTDDRTPILIVGLPRSGTTLLEQIVSSHPDVHACSELDYWSLNAPKWFEQSADALAKAAPGLQAGYLARLRRDAPATPRATDKLPFNYIWAGLIHVLFPNAIFLHCRRNPIDTCLSIYTTDFTVAWHFASSPADLAAYYRSYKRITDHWRTVLPSNRWLDVDYEKVVSDPAKAAREVIDFCGLSWNDACLRPEQNPRAVPTASHWQARQPVYRTSVERWRRYEPWLGELRELA